MNQQLPTDSQERKNIPLARGCLDYFPAALAAVAEISRIGNEKHNPGEEMHHARGKSSDHADCILRHLTDRGTVDPDDGVRHSAKVAWRALALLQEELEAAGAPLARGAKLPPAKMVAAPAAPFKPLPGQAAPYVSPDRSVPTWQNPVATPLPRPALHDPLLATIGRCRCSCCVVPS